MIENWPDVVVILGALSGLIFTVLRISNHVGRRDDDIAKKMLEIEVDLKVMKERHPEMQREIEDLKGKFEKIREAFMKYFTDKK